MPSSTNRPLLALVHLRVSSLMLCGLRQRWARLPSSSGKLRGLARLKSSNTPERPSAARQTLWDSLYSRQRRSITLGASLQAESHLFFFLSGCLPPGRSKGKNNFLRFSLKLFQHCARSVGAFAAPGPAMVAQLPGAHECMYLFHLKFLFSLSFARQKLTGMCRAAPSCWSLLLGSF